MVDANEGPTEASVPAATVLLLHSTPDGGSHVDWMVAIGPTQDPDERSLATFRLPARLDELPPGGSMIAEALADHRNRYLSFEGEIGGNRGAVRRLAVGEASVLLRTERAWRLEIRWTGLETPQSIVLERMGAGWRVSALDG